MAFRLSHFTLIVGFLIFSSTLVASDLSPVLKNPELSPVQKKAQKERFNELLQALGARETVTVRTIVTVTVAEQCEVANATAPADNDAQRKFPKVTQVPEADNDRQFLDNSDIEEDDNPPQQATRPAVEMPQETAPPLAAPPLAAPPLAAPPAAAPPAAAPPVAAPPAAAPPVADAPPAAAPPAAPPAAAPPAAAPVVDAPAVAVPPVAAPPAAAAPVADAPAAAAPLLQAPPPPAANAPPAQAPPPVEAPAVVAPAQDGPQALPVQDGSGTPLLQPPNGVGEFKSVLDLGTLGAPTSAPQDGEPLQIANE